MKNEEETKNLTTKKARVLGIIPSRYGSSRFPGKPLADIAGRPLVAWVVDAAKKASSLDEVIVATDDDRIAAAVAAQGGKAVMTPSDLPSGTDRIACAAGNFADDDILVNIQGDEPLIDPALIDALVARLKEPASRWDMATAVTPIKRIEDLNARTVVKVVLDRDDGALYFSRAPIPCDRDHEPDIASGLYVRHLGIYAYRGGFLKRYISEKPCALEQTEKLEQLRALWMGAKIAVIRTDDEGVGVDTPEDAVRVAAILRGRHERGRMVKSIMGIIAMAAVGVAAQASAVEFHSPADFNPTWESAKPGTSYSTDLPTAALLGNGALGAVNGGDANHKLFVLTRGDIWSCGDFTWGNADNNARPISFAHFSIGPGMHSVKSTDTLDLPTATLRSVGGFGKGRVKLDTYVASTEDLLIVTGVSDADADWAVHMTAHNERKSFPIEVKSSKDAFYVRRSTINLLPQGDPRGWTTNATAALSVLGTELGNFSTTEGRRATAWVKIRANKPFAFVVSSNPTRRFTWEELVKIRAAHEAWWSEWWARSRIATGDEELDRFYVGQVYLLGAGVRKGKFPPGLYGIWVTTDNPKWHNDFHMNYNYVGTFYGCFAANRCEVADPMPDPLIDYLPQAIRNAKEVLPNLDTCHGRKYKNTRAYLNSHPDVANGIDDAAFYPVALGPWGASAEGGDSHWSQVSDGAFQCAVMCTHWEYTLDRAYLRKVWPVLDKTANFFLKWCEKEGDRYNVWDSHWEGSGLAKNSAPALGCVKHLFETLVDAAQVLREMGLDVSDAKLAAWKDMHEHLAKLPVGVYSINGKPVKMLSGVENADGSANPSGGNALNLESVIPGEQFAFDVTPEFRALAVGAVNGNIAKSPKSVWTGCNQTPKLFATAIRAGYSPKVIIDAFKKHQLAIMQKNFHIHDGVHGVEKIGAMEFIQSMLIQCDHGYVKVFPNWTGADAKFENLRAKGCFLVSAEMKNGKVVRVSVKSENGGRFRIVDPRTARGAVPTKGRNELVGRSPRDRRSPPSGWSRGKTRNSGEPTLERNFKPGETVEINMDWN